MIDLDFSITNGDCRLVYDDENMINACIRRLNTLLDTTLYEVYGSNLRGLLGLKKSEVNLQFLSQRINDCLSQDIRITNSSVTCEYLPDGIRAEIAIIYEDNELDFEFTYEAGGETDAG